MDSTNIILALLLLGSGATFTLVSYHSTQATEKALFTLLSVLSLVLVVLNCLELAGVLE